MKISRSQFLVIFIAFYSSTLIYGQHFTSKANAFIESLSADQKKELLRPFSDTQRTNWDFVPREDRTGIRIGYLSAVQLNKFYDLVLATAGDITLEKIKNVRKHEAILRGIENRPIDDKYRDTTKYFIQLFGMNDGDKTWGWKFEGHHICINYVIKDEKVYSATPNVHCSNPAVVLKGAQEGYVLLKPERDMAKAFLDGLTAEQKTKAITSTETPKEIINYKPRKAVLDNFSGLNFGQLSPAQQTKFKELVHLYVTRASKFFVKDIEARIAKAGWDKWSFIWMGSEDVTPGHTHYYRLQSPEFIIEYDNFQNNGNHVHSIFRDVKNDFGDALAEHYDKEHKN